MFLLFKHLRRIGSLGLSWLGDLDLAFPLYRGVPIHGIGYASTRGPTPRSLLESAIHIGKDGQRNNSRVSRLALPKDLPLLILSFPSASRVEEIKFRKYLRTLGQKALTIEDLREIARDDAELLRRAPRIPWRPNFDSISWVDSCIDRSFKGNTGAGSVSRSLAVTDRKPSIRYPL